MQPLIGITTYGRIERPVPSDHYEEHYSIPVVFVQAVRRAGGIPVLLPPGQSDPAEWLGRVDGLVFAGGTDIDPARYAAARTSAVLAPDPERDESELTLVGEVIASDTPSLFVCRGMQALNVGLGGSLHPHIPDLGIGDIHRDDGGLWAEHEIAAVPGSRVAEAMGAVSVTSCSGHHQAVDSVADSLTVTATAPDGIVEALEVADRSWIVGVQWHPEVTADQDPTQQGLFDKLVSVAAATSNP